MNSNRTLWIVLLALALVVCCCCCALAWGATTLTLGGVRSFTSAVGPETGNWESWLRSWDNNEWRNWAGPWTGGWGAQASAPIQQSLTVSGPVILDLSIPVGDVTVRTGQAGQVKIEGTKRAYGATDADAKRILEDIEVKVDQSGDKVWLRVSGLPTRNIGRSPQIDLTVTVPKQTSLTANIGVGRLQVNGTNGDATINADVGDVILTDVLPADKLFVKTRVSNVDFSGALTPNGKYDIATDVGRIAMRLPRDSSFKIDARSDVGDVSVGFPVSGRSSRDALVGKEVQGEVGQNPTTNLYLRSRIGEISVNPGR